MTVKDLLDLNYFELVSDVSDNTITKVFCCDLLSVAMGKAPAGCAWVTVMANVNTLAVASLTDTSVIILAEGASFDDTLVNKAKEEGICVFKTDKPIFEAACLINDKL